MVVNALGNSEFFRELDHNASLRKSGVVIMYGLSCVIAVHYLINALRFGPEFANSQVALGVPFLWLIIVVIYVNFSHFKLEQKLWIPLFKREMKKKRRKRP